MAFNTACKKSSATVVSKHAGTPVVGTSRTSAYKSDGAPVPGASMDSAEFLKAMEAPLASSTVQENQYKN